MNLLYDYCNEEIQGLDNQGKPVIKLGVTRIKDRMLLTEMLNYSSEGNFDRIVAFRHALAYDEHLKKINPIVHVQEEPTEPQRDRKPFHNPFTSGVGGPFSGMRRKPF